MRVTIIQAGALKEDCLTGDRLQHYQILEKIGEGGMGVVYKALDTRLDRPVAIKTIPSINDPNRQRQFVWEARAAAGLRHPNIVVVHDVACDHNTDFIVMEYIPGHSLSDYLARGPLSIKDALQYSREIASALEAAHAAGIVHRDLKPSNILVTPEGSIKLVDFGLARLHQQDADSQSDVPAIAGTCGYMSPEQAQGDRATFQSDIFSFGAVLYEMVTGQRAFEGKSAASLAAVLRDEPRGIASLAPECPPAFQRIVEHCLRKDRNRRFQHIGDVRLALEEVTPARRGVHWGGAGRWRLAPLHGAAVISAILGAWLLFSRDSTPEPNSAPIPLTSFPGIETAAAWSPDGRQVAFNWNGEREDNEDIYLIQPGSSQKLRLTTDAGIDDKPAWSPDGRWIAYTHIARGPAPNSLNLISPLGGLPRILLTSATVLNVSNWTPDGRAVLVDAAAGPDQPEAAFAISLDTAQRRQLTWPPAGIPGDLSPAISPNGKTLAFVRKTAWRTSELYLQDLGAGLIPSGTPRRVTDLGYVSRPAWTPDSGRVLFEAHRDGVGIWQVDRNGKRVRPVFGAPNTASLPAVSKRPSGQTSLAFTNAIARFSIWRYSTDRGPGGPRVELVPSSRNQSGPRYSNDGKRLAFISSRTGYMEIWVANADGSQPVQLTDLRHQLSEVGHWSPDGSLIAFGSQDRGSRQIYVVGSSGGPAVPITKEEGVDVGSGWTADGRGYYYDSVKSGHREVWKVPRGGGRPELMATNGAHGGFESPAGTFYYWLEDSGHAGSLMRRTPQGDEELPLVPRGCPRCGTALSSKGFYYAVASMNEIYRFDEKTGRSVRVLKFPPMFFSQFTVSADGRWCAYGLMGTPSIDLMIMEDFH
jgi:serine/threonine protein kinase